MIESISVWNSWDSVRVEVRIGGVVAAVCGAHSSGVFDLWRCSRVGACVDFGFVL